MAQICNNDCNAKEIDLPGFDQGFTHHVITFKTNHVFVDKRFINLSEMIDQTLPVMEQNNNVCFTA